MAARGRPSNAIMRGGPARMSTTIAQSRARHENGGWLGELRAARAPERRFLREVVLPSLARPGDKVLLAGCSRAGEGDLQVVARSGATCWTLDADPGRARWGARRRHIALPIEAIADAISPEYFDAILLNDATWNGVGAALAACASVLRPDGLLVVGRDTDRTSDPSGVAVTWFRSPALGHRRMGFSVPGRPFVFEYFWRRKEAVLF
jgi:hypothetical protein